MNEYNFIINLAYDKKMDWFLFPPIHQGDLIYSANGIEIWLYKKLEERKIESLEYIFDGNDFSELRTCNNGFIVRCLIKTNCLDNFAYSLAEVFKLRLSCSLTLPFKS